MGTYRNLKFTATHEAVIGSVEKKPVVNRVAALVDATNWAANKIFNFKVESNLKRKLDIMYPQIAKALTSTNIVLVVVQYEQWECQTAAGGNLQFILSVFIAAAAGDRHLAYRIYENREKIGVFKQAPNNGKIYGRKVFL